MTRKKCSTIRRPRRAVTAGRQLLQEIHDYTGAYQRTGITQNRGQRVAADIMALVLLTALVQQARRYCLLVWRNAFGVPMAMAAHTRHSLREKTNHKRSMPGRIIGVSKDAAGNTALRMAMQTREQHSSRKRTPTFVPGTSQRANIASLYAVYHGPVGLKRIANRIHRVDWISRRRACKRSEAAQLFRYLCVEVQSGRAGACRSG